MAKAWIKNEGRTSRTSLQISCGDVERREESRMTPRVSLEQFGRMELPFFEMGKNTGINSFYLRGKSEVLYRIH